MGEATQVPRKPFMMCVVFLIVGLVVGAAAIYGIGPAREVPGPTVTAIVTRTEAGPSATVTKTETGTATVTVTETRLTTVTTTVGAATVTRMVTILETATCWC